MSDRPRVAIYQDLSGILTVYSDGDVEVLWVDERFPEDRSYRMSPAPIPPGLINENPGHKDDGSPAAARLHRAVNELQGKPHLKDVSETEE